MSYQKRDYLIKEENYIIKRVGSWHIRLSNGEYIKCVIPSKGYMYMINVSFRNLYWCVFNLNNGYCTPYAKLDTIKQECEKIIKEELKSVKKAVQMSIFDLI